MNIKVKVYEPLHYAIEQKAFFMWCAAGKPDGEEIVNHGLGERKLGEYHWMIAEMMVKMEAEQKIRKLKCAWSEDAWIDLEECTSGLDTPLTRPDKIFSIDYDSCEETVMPSIEKWKTSQKDKLSH